MSKPDRSTNDDIIVMPTISEIVEPKSEPKKKKKEKKVQVLEERIHDTLPSDTEPGDDE